jgi:hypothetical protein
VRRLVRHTLDDGLLEASDVDRLVARKHEMLGRDSVLTFEIDTARFSDVAGLANLKLWLDRRREAFPRRRGRARRRRAEGNHAARRAGLRQEPRREGGRGSWGTPLMRLDFGALYNKFLGETERNLREALKSRTRWRHRCCGWTRSRKASRRTTTTAASRAGSSARC